MTDDEVIGTALSAQSGLLTIRPGTYEVKLPVLIPRQCWVDARGVTIRPAKSFSGRAVVDVSGTADNRCGQVTIDGLRIEGAGKSMIGLLSEFSVRLTIRQVWVTGVRGTGIAIRHAWDAHLLQCSVMKCGSVDSDLPAVELSADAAKGSWTNTLNMERCTVEEYQGTAIRCTDQVDVWIDRQKIHGMRKPDSEKSKVGIECTRCRCVRVRDPLIVLTRVPYVEGEGCADIALSGTMTGAGRQS